MFKIGDKVEIKRLSDNLNFNERYTIDGVSTCGMGIKLKNNPRWYESCRFELIPAAPPVQQETTASAAGNTVKSLIQTMEASGPKKLSVKIDNYVITIKKND